ncbi:MAG: hypothetical protein HQ521_11575 [Bacteroidetes bacterium]|nr:hypothetical protein [Bacteroidota bacterium]
MYKKLISSTRNKIILLLLISLVVFTGWEYGMETGYLKVLVGTTNLSVGVIKKDTKVELETTISKENPYQFKVSTIVDGRKGSYPQEIGGIVQPFVIILSWQIFLFFVLTRRSALRSLAVNFVIFLLVQVIFLIFLTGYYTSDFQKFVYDMMMDSFYIIAIILIIKDNMLYPIFRRSN